MLTNWLCVIVNLTFDIILICFSRKNIKKSLKFIIINLFISRREKNMMGIMRYSKPLYIIISEIQKIVTSAFTVIALSVTSENTESIDSIFT